MVVNRAAMSDGGTYTLKAENRNGSETVDLDLIVLDTLPDCECDMYRSGNKQCSCTHSYTGPDEHIKRLVGMSLPDY